MKLNVAPAWPKKLPQATATPNTRHVDCCFGKSMWSGLWLPAESPARTPLLTGQESSADQLGSKVCQSSHPYRHQPYRMLDIRLTKHQVVKLPKSCLSPSSWSPDDCRGDRISEILSLCRVHQHESGFVPEWWNAVCPPGTPMSITAFSVILEAWFLSGW